MENLFSGHLRNTGCPTVVTETCQIHVLLAIYELTSVITTDTATGSILEEMNRKRASRIDVSLTYKSPQEKWGLPLTSALVPSSLACQCGRLSVNWSAAEHLHLHHYVEKCTRRFLNCRGYWGASRWGREGLVSCLRVRFGLNPGFVAHVCM